MGRLRAGFLALMLASAPSGPAPLLLAEPSSYEPSEADLAQEAAARFADYRERGEAALAAGNLRDALAALEQALAAQRDPALERTAADLRAKVGAHDDALSHGKVLASEPETLDEAVEELAHAREAWDSAEAREALAAAQRALARRKVQERRPPSPPPEPSRSAPPLPTGAVRFVPIQVDPFLPQPFAPGPVILTPGPVLLDPEGQGFADFPIASAAPIAHRLAALLVETGDTFLADGHPDTACHHYEAALAILPSAPVVLTRVAAVRKRFPGGRCPPVTPGPPRLVLLPFDVTGTATAVEVELTNRLASLLGRDNEVITPVRITETLARLGLRPGDFVHDDVSRREIARGLNFRRMLYGSVRSSPAGLSATATLAAAESGQRLAVRTITGKNAAELLARAAELTR